MNDLTRREFLRRGAVGLGALAGGWLLSGCGQPATDGAGPTGGSLDDVKKLDTIITSPDIVAADSYAATLFDLRPEELSYIPAGATLGLGRMDLNSLKIEELTVGG